MHTVADYFPIRASVLKWACERVNLPFSELSKKYKCFSNEQNGLFKLTMKQLENLSSKLRYPLFYLMLDSPVKEIDQLSISDFRTVNSKKIRPSINLKEEVDFCQSQQDWYSDFVRQNDIIPFEYINKFTLNDSPKSAGDKLRKYLNISYESANNPNEYYKILKSIFEDHNILVNTSKVLKHTKNKLSVSEFRGFALTDKFAPLIFVNGNDSINAQVFTLCHELGHICLGISGVSDISSKNDFKSEKWCNEFAANVLLPEKDICKDFDNFSDIDVFLEKSVEKYHVSLNALLIRILDLKLISKADFEYYWEQAEIQYKNFLESANKKKTKSGGSYYRTVNSRLSRLLTKSLIAATSVGQTTYREATSLLGLKSVEVFCKFARQNGEQ